MMETFSCAGRNPITLEVFQGYGQVGTGSLLALSGIRGRAVAADICSAPSPSTSQGR